MDSMLDIALRRIPSILRARYIATMRILEQKISDAGPTNQRVEPHVLTAARRILEDRGTLVREHRATGRWYRLATTPQDTWRNRLRELEPILRRIQDGRNHQAVGQAFEIAVYRALLTEQHPFWVFGGFRNLDTPAQGSPRKTEPPSMIDGKSLDGDTKLDFLLLHPSAGPLGLEVKNTREWIYPQSDEMRSLLSKCCDLDAVPVMLCRRYSYATYSVLHRCGVLLYQNYNQLMPESLRELAGLARDKDLLGYHDIRVGDAPSPRLRHFLGTNLPPLVSEARSRFSVHQDLICQFASAEMSYEAFAARTKRRDQGLDEDSGVPLWNHEDW